MNEMASSSSIQRTSVLFVCLGNICRSPLAEGILKHLLEEAGVDDEWFVDSAGTGAYHVGERADPRSCAVAETHGISLSGRARQLHVGDFDAFDYIIAMDLDNLENIRSLAADGLDEARATLHLLRDFDPDGTEDLEVPDPYFGGDGGFEDVYRMVYRSCVAFLEEKGAG